MHQYCITPCPPPTGPSSHLQRQQQCWLVLLGVVYEVLQGLHLRQAADAAVLGKPKVVINLR